MSADMEMMKWHLVLTSLPLHSLAPFLHRINQPVIHAYLFLPLSCSIHPSCLPPLAFIRTVDGESRADVITRKTRVLTHVQSIATCEGERRHMCYSYRPSGSWFPARLKCFTVWRNRGDPSNPTVHLKSLHSRRQRSGWVEVQGRPRWVGVSVDADFLVEWVEQRRLLLCKVCMSRKGVCRARSLSCVIV